MLNNISQFFNKIISVFSTFSVIDFLDICVVAVIIYVCIRIIRETRAMQLLKGIVFLAAVYGAVYLLNMEASSYLFKTMFSNFLIILIVLFAPDIRNILEQIGKGSAGKNLRTIIHAGVAVDVVKIDNAIKSTCRAVADMSDKKIGALIVFENETMLGNIIESGTILDAKPTRELIENIFFPKSPLHDGAMVIRDGSVYAAGCILPLTKKDISSSLGTRHRAGLGISEESDAIVVIVSEETGKISVAQGGQLKIGISDGDLREVLISTFIPTGDSSDDKKITKLVRRIKK